MIIGPIATVKPTTINDEDDDDQTFLAAWTHLLVVASPADTNSGMDRPICQTVYDDDDNNDDGDCVCDD